MDLACGSSETGQALYSIAHLNVVKVCRVLECRLVPVQLSHPTMQFGEFVPDEIAALEVSAIHRIVANDCRVQPDVRFGQGVSDQVVFAFQQLV